MRNCFPGRRNGRCYADGSLRRGIPCLPASGRGQCGLRFLWLPCFGCCESPLAVWRSGRCRALPVAVPCVRCCSRLPFSMFGPLLCVSGRCSLCTQLLSVTVSDVRAGTCVSGRCSLCAQLLPVAVSDVRAGAMCFESLSLPDLASDVRGRSRSLPGCRIRSARQVPLSLSPKSAGAGAWPTRYRLSSRRRVFRDGNGAVVTRRPLFSSVCGC